MFLGVGQGGQAQGRPEGPVCPQVHPSEQPHCTHLAQIQVTGDTSRKSEQFWAGSYSPSIQGGCSFVRLGAWASPRATRVLTGQSSCRVGVPLPTPRKRCWPPPCPHPHPCLLGAPVRPLMPTLRPAGGQQRVDGGSPGTKQMEEDRQGLPSSGCLSWGAARGGLCGVGVSRITPGPARPYDSAGGRGRCVKVNGAVIRGEQGRAAGCHLTLERPQALQRRPGADLAATPLSPL